MGLSTRVEGVREPDEKWRTMKAAFDACRAAGVAVPKDVNEFFGWDDPYDAGIVVRLGGEYGEIHESVKVTDDGYLVDLSKLPTNITKLRFVVSW